MAVYRACILSTLLYGSEAWALYATQEKRLNTFHLRHLKITLGIQWHHRVTNNEVLHKAGIDSLFSLLKQRRLRWLGHVRRMEDGRIPKDLLYGELSRGKRSQGRPKQCFRNVCRKDLRDCGMDIDRWETLADNRDAWRNSVKTGVSLFETNHRREADEKRISRKGKPKPSQSYPSHRSDFVCRLCGRDCGAFIGLHNHLRRCSRIPN